MFVAEYSIVTWLYFAQQISANLLSSVEYRRSCRKTMPHLQLVKNKVNHTTVRYRYRRYSFSLVKAKTRLVGKANQSVTRTAEPS